MTITAKYPMTTNDRFDAMRECAKMVADAEERYQSAVAAASQQYDDAVPDVWESSAATDDAWVIYCDAVVRARDVYSDATARAVTDAVAYLDDQEEAETVTIRIPQRFVDDHYDRLLPTPTIYHRTSRHYWISPDDDALPELISDAKYYAHALGPDGCGTGLATAARALLRALDREGA